jgi:membrane-bound lytic murein transglycosylase D
LSEFYFPIIDTIFKAYKVPLELKYIAVLESGLNPKAIGKGVAGMWQFTKGTAQKFGLTVNSQVDERRAIIESTVAIAKYIKMLGEMYNDWHLVLAAYNCGYGRLNAAIRSAGGSRDFKKIYPFLPSYTQHFVPTFIGIAYAFNYYKEHDITPVPHSLPQAIDTVRISKRMHLQQVATALQIDIKMLRSINFHYLKSVIPANGSRTYNLYIPLEQKVNFIALQDSILYAPVYTTPHSANNAAEVINTNATGSLLHKVRAGDTLYGIAKRYKVTVSELKQWNSIRGNIIKAGQVLIVQIKAPK